MSQLKIIGLGTLLLGLILVLYAIRAARELASSFAHGNMTLSGSTVWLTLFGLIFIMFGWFLLAKDEKN